MNAFRRLHPIHDGHDYIHEHEVGLGLFAKLDRFRTVCGLTRDRNIRYSDQHPGDDVMNMPMIIDNKHTNGSFCTHICIIWLKQSQGNGIQTGHRL